MHLTLRWIIFDCKLEGKGSPVSAPIGFCRLYLLQKRYFISMGLAGLVVNLQLLYASLRNVVARAARQPRAAVRRRQTPFVLHRCHIFPWYVKC